MDNYSILFYKSQFNVAPVNPEEDFDLLWQIVQHVKGWMTRKWNYRGRVVLPRELSEWSKLKHGGRIIAENNTVFIESAYLFDEKNEASDWACRIVEHFELKDGTSPRQWVTDIGYEQQPDGSALLSCIVSYSNRAQFIGPHQIQPQPSVPKFISRILYDRKLQCSVGNDRVCLNPLELRVGEWPDFMSRVTDSRRKMPYILISPKLEKDENGNPVYLIQPWELHEKLLGTAQVYYAADQSLLAEADYLNPDYACYDGAIHVYMPGGRHRWFGAEDISRYGAEEMSLFIRRAFAESFNYFDRYFLIDDCRRRMVEQHGSKQVEELKRRHAQDMEETEKVFDEASDLALEWERKYKEAAAERDNFRAINEEYQKMFEESRDRGDGWQSGSDAAIPSELPPTSDRKIALADVVGYFRFAFGDRVAFTDKALKDDCTLTPKELWKCLYALGTQMIALYRQPDSGEIFREFKRRTGIEVGSSEGSTTRKNPEMMKQYNAYWNGETVNIEPHLKCSGFQRIHFGYSKSKDLLVVGYIGDHLDTAGTHKVK